MTLRVSIEYSNVELPVVAANDTSFRLLVRQQRRSKILFESAQGDIPLVAHHHESLKSY